MNERVQGCIADTLTNIFLFIGTGQKSPKLYKPFDLPNQYNILSYECIMLIIRKFEDNTFFLDYAKNSVSFLSMNIRL